MPNEINKTFKNINWKQILNDFKNEPFDETIFDAWDESFSNKDSVFNKLGLGKYITKETLELKKKAFKQAYEQKMERLRAMSFKELKEEFVRKNAAPLTSMIYGSIEPNVKTIRKIVKENIISEFAKLFSKTEKKPRSFLKPLTEIFKVDVPEPNWYYTLKKQNITPSNIGIVAETLLDEKQLTKILKAEDKWNCFFEQNRTKVAFSMALAMNQEKTESDFKTILTGKTAPEMFKYLKAFSKIIKEKYHFKNFYKSEMISLNHFNNHPTFISVFEFDFLNHNGDLFEIKTSHDEWNINWIYQTILYFLVIKKYLKIDIQTIYIINPLTNVNYIFKIGKLPINWNKLYKWLEENYVL